LNKNLEILYKNIDFLDRREINNNLPEYKIKKQKMLEEKLRKEQEMLKGKKKKKSKEEVQSPEKV